MRVNSDSVLETPTYYNRGRPHIVPLWRQLREFVVKRVINKLPQMKTHVVLRTLSLESDSYSASEYFFEGSSSYSNVYMTCNVDCFYNCLANRAPK